MHPSNDDIIEYAKVWTGFTQQELRGNVEYSNPSGKSPINPLKINSDWRDMHPKLGLKKSYIGDRYPLCVDRPKYHFLRKNAKYNLLGSKATPELHTDPAEWEMNDMAVRISLSANSSLYNILCNPSGGSCNYKSTVVLDTDLDCYMDECNVDTVRVVKVGGVYYEYISEPCVEQAFFNNAMKVVSKDYSKISCANPFMESASAACCPSEVKAVRQDRYWGERMTLQTALDRCEAMDYSSCPYPAVKDCTSEYRW